MTKTLSLATYHIIVGDFTQALSQFLAKKNYSQLFILVDENTHKHCLPLLLNKVPSLHTAHLIQIQSGEIHKNLETCQYIWQQLLAVNADRQSLLINLGGGVIGDMGGFAAAAYKRGIDFIQIPTSLLAQVDASIGGKLGIDFENGKNLIGFFQNPQLVCIHPQFLKSLPKRQVLNGFAEVIKHALIADVNYWQKIASIHSQNIENVDWSEIIFTSLEIKKQIVTTDPYEKGMRKILNFGHTIGHAIESYSLENDNDPLLHGEAIALGMMAELYLSVQQLHFPKKDYQLLVAYLQQLYPTYNIPKNQWDSLFNYLKKDKKNTTTSQQKNRLNFTLLPKIGEAHYNQTAEHQAIKAALTAIFPNN